MNSTQIVGVADPARKYVTQYQRDTEPVRLKVKQQLEVPRLIPGFRLGVAEILS